MANNRDILPMILQTYKSNKCVSKSEAWFIYSTSLLVEKAVLSYWGNNYIHNSLLHDPVTCQSPTSCCHHIGYKDISIDFYTFRP